MNECPQCDKIFHDDDLIYVESCDEFVCESCHENKFFKCERCDDIVINDNCCTVNNGRTENSWCHYCYENYTMFCEHCDTSYDYEIVNFPEEDCCSFCNDDGEQGEIIHSYSYKPTPIIKLVKFNTRNLETVEKKEIVDVGYDVFKRMTKKRPIITKGISAKSKKFETEIHKRSFGNYQETAEVIGLELEVENKLEQHSISDLANGLIDDMDDRNERFIYLKRDGSLDNGFEIVTHPQSYDAWITNWKTFQPIFKLHEKGIRSHDTRTCGLHFSINRGAFTPLQLLKFSTFIYWNPMFIKDISRRTWRGLVGWSNIFSQPSYKITENTYMEIMSEKNHWMRRQTTFNKIGDVYSPVYSKKSLMSNTRNDRNTAINPTGDRIECRFFRGTLKESTLKMNLQFVHGVFEFAKHTSFENLNVFKFKRFCENNNLNLVAEYMNTIPHDKMVFFTHYYMDTMKSDEDLRNKEHPISYFTMYDDKQFKLEA